jgi:hypothetical protein
MTPPGQWSMPSGGALLSGSGTVPMVPLGGWIALKESIVIEQREGPRVHPPDTSGKYQQAFLHLSLMSHDYWHL